MHHGIEVAVARLPRILLWSLITTTVGLALRAIAERVPAGGRLLAMAGGAAWAAATYFVVPALALDDVGPVGAIRTSARTVRGRWGEAAVGAGGIGLADLAGDDRRRSSPADCWRPSHTRPAPRPWRSGCSRCRCWRRWRSAWSAPRSACVFQTALYLYAGDGDPGDFDEGDLARGLRESVTAHDGPSARPFRRGYR